MKRRSNLGFTIIETMLFLGLTGILVMAMLVGTGTAIGAQRYQDSAVSLRAVFQQQYADVMTVANDRSSEWVCNNQAEVDEASVGGGIGRGQSDCVILGKYISSDDGTNIDISTVVGRIPSESVAGDNDLTAIEEHQPSISPIFPQSYSPDWGGILNPPESDELASFSVLIIRSPSSGVVRTFIDPDSAVANRNIRSLLTQESLNSELEVCLNPDGVTLVKRIALAIAPGATSANAVEIRGEELTSC